MKKVVKVRIAVAVDPSGNWSAAGWKQDGVGYESTVFGSVIDALQEGERRYWVEAELEVPEIETISGNVSDA